MKSKVVIAAHDAGGAEILSAWCERNRTHYEILHFLGGPAVKIFQRDFGPVHLFEPDIVYSLGKNDFLLTGSSLDADLERKAIRLAKEKGLHCVTFLDHWDLYRERFAVGPNGELDLPDEIWVGDPYALEHAKKTGFPESKVRQVPNPYFEKLKSRYREARGQTAAPVFPFSILYICEPISRKLSATFGEAAKMYDHEIQILDYFLASACRHKNQINKVTLRLHPSEPSKKYEELVIRYAGRMDVRYSNAGDILEDMRGHDTVVGIESMGLIIGVLLDKKTYSCITGKQWKISLPYEEIRKIDRFDLMFNGATAAVSGKEMKNDEACH